VSLPAPAPVSALSMTSETSLDKFIIGGKNNNDIDNNKELKEFNKMFKKQNRKSYKSKNSNTRRNKKNDK